MGSEKPPRRTRAKQEPEVLDLQANDAPAEATPTPQDDVLAEALTELPDAVPVEATADPDAPPPAGDAADTSELPDAEPKPTEEERPEEIGTAEALAAEPESEAEPVKPAPEAAAVDDTPANAEPVIVERKSGVAGAAFAGILGGLVALAGAGGLQYAGYLPSLAPPPPAPAAPAVADTSALEAEVAALKSQVATLAAQPAPAAPAVDTSALEARIAALETREPESAPAPVDLAPVEEKIATLTSQVGQIEGAVAGADEKQQSLQTQLIDRLQKVEAEVNDPARRNAVARAIAASGLKAAIDRGGSFLGELETFAGVAADDPAVAELTPYAETGVPTRATLIASFPGAANAVLDVLNHPDPNQSTVDRLWASALSLVKVRPVGHVEGDTPEAFIARSEEALKNGDLERALGEWSRLPEQGRAAAADFEKALIARIEVEKLVGATLKGAVIGASGN